MLDLSWLKNKYQINHYYNCYILFCKFVKNSLDSSDQRNLTLINLCRHHSGQKRFIIFFPGYNYEEPANPLRLPAKAAKSLDSAEEVRSNRIIPSQSNSVDLVAQSVDMDQKGNAPIQTCFEMAVEGKMTPLPGVNCIHTVHKDRVVQAPTIKATFKPVETTSTTTTTSTPTTPSTETATDPTTTTASEPTTSLTSEPTTATEPTTLTATEPTATSTSQPPTTTVTEPRTTSSTEPTTTTTATTTKLITTTTLTTEQTTPVSEETTSKNVLDVRKAFEQRQDLDVVTYDVDLNEDNVGKEETYVDSYDEVQDDVVEEEEDDDVVVVKAGEGGKLLKVEVFPIVGRDFDLATKLIRLNPRQIDDY